MAHEDFLIPDWPAPAKVKSCISTRLSGDSLPPYDANNLALHVEDNDAAVLSNRQKFQQRAAIPGVPQWLEQIHGTRVVEAEGDERVRTADACITCKPNQPCTVLTADCLPLLLCDTAGTTVAAVHAGWRGLADGVIREAVEAFELPANQLLVYLGPAIGPQAFEVGIDVLEAFFEGAISAEHAEAISSCFIPSIEKPLGFYADLYGLARAELSALGVSQRAIYGGDFCTYTDSERFFSYRRDGVTGRMASVIWLEG
ncbi:peptidoglycan editing factor PgeF [Maricurvus nonylphenolicus]|uniref:peptidoglycan editing factor PgeF n=1 Tax=Maricurvus nonylphenolicus TaxID=1008307 RepID=UPI0036F321D8